MDPEYRGLLCGVEKSARYHMRRRAHYNRIGRTFSFFIIIAGSAAFARLRDTATAPGSSQASVQPFWLGLVIAAIGAIQLVWDPAKRAKDHEVLFREFQKLIAEMKGSTLRDKDTLASWLRRRELIEADEPETFNALEADCRNEVLRVFYEPDEAAEKRQVIPWYARLLMHWVPFESWEFPPKKFQTRG